jgi:predicted nucleic acid-binding protein
VPVFVDTNVLVYAEDSSESSKQEIARDLLSGLWHTHDGVLSTQVLGELFTTLTRKVRKPVKPPTARRIIEEYCSWPLVEINGTMVLDAIDISRSKRICFWDALIVIAAQSRRCDTLLTEDLTHGQRFGQLRIVNPFI